MIKNIKIWNYRSISYVSVDLSPITALIGKSGTGKSNFINAIKCYRDFLVGNFDISAIAPHRLHAKKPQGFEITLNIPGYDLDFNYIILLFQNHIYEERLSYGSEVIFHQLHDMSKGTFQQKGEYVKAPNLNTRPPLGQIVVNKLPGLELPTIFYSFMVSSIAIYNFDYDQYLNEGSHKGPGDSLDYKKIAKNLFTDYRSAIPRKTINSALNFINNDISNFDIDNIQQVKNVLVTHKTASESFPISITEESSGLKRFFSYMLAIHQTPPKNVLIFEEPENGIYRNALTTLIEEFQVAKANGKQIIFTTHSPDLLNHFTPDEIRVCELNNLETEIGMLDSGQSDAVREHDLEAGELLTITEARIKKGSL